MGDMTGNHYETGPAQDETHNGGQGHNQHGEQPYMEERSMSWHAIATIAGFVLWGIAAPLACTLWTDVREIRLEMVRQNGVDLQMRQQVDINTRHLGALDEDIKRIDVDHGMKIERLFAAQEYWLHEYNWKVPPGRKP